MLIQTIIGCSLLLQFITIFISLRLILLTGWTKAWILLSLGITTMGIRRLVIFVELLSGNSGRPPEMFYEITGLIGSAVMLGGVVFIKPVFLSLKTAEKEQRELAEKLQDAFSKIKILSGMLPICASCKKIRDDRGDWHQMEAYIRNNSEAEFTHGLCPGCAEKALKEVEKLTKSYKREDGE
jgi:hypothetical protein